LGVGTARHRIGIDENGLGARLGPLVVTAVVAEVSERGNHEVDHYDPQTFAHLLGDSKQLIRHGDVRLGEAWARVLTCESATRPRGLLELMSLIPVDRLMARCPRHAKNQCWNNACDSFLASEALMDQVRSGAQALRKLGIRPNHVWSRLVCTDELNARAASGENRFLVDLHCMEELIVKSVGEGQSPLRVVCGKVGGMHDYTHYFDILGQTDPQVVHESKESSVYRWPDLGEVTFKRNADAFDPLVMLASLVGKYLRELFVSRIGDFFSQRIVEIRKPSGYHDSVTMDFTRATSELRRQMKFPQSCFERVGRRDP
jgi:ribonuclease HII